MKDIFKAYKFRIYPDKAQQEYFEKCFGSVRFIYNQMLSDRIEHYKLTGERLSHTPAAYKNDFPWLSEVDSLALSNAAWDLNKAFKNFFREKSVGHPKFKSKKKSSKSYRTNNQGGTVFIENGYLKLPKLKTKVKIVQHRAIEGNVKSCTISKTYSGKYFASILAEAEHCTLPVTDCKVGVDLGIKTFATCSNGDVFENQMFFRRSEKRLAKLQKDLSRKNKGSKNREKARLKVAKLHEKITNQRNDYLHKISIKLIRENQAIVIEDLKIKDMVRDTMLSKALSDAAWSRFRMMLEYKAEWYGRTMVLAPSDYASSQLCSVCGYKNAEVKKLNLKVWSCPQCGASHDRDFNAAVNLVKLAM